MQMCILFTAFCDQRCMFQQSGNLNQEGCQERIAHPLEDVGSLVTFKTLRIGVLILTNPLSTHIRTL